MPSRSASSLLAAAVLALVLAGCGADGGAVSQEAGEFTGEELAVANTVGDLADAAGQRDAEQICADLLAARLVEQLGGGRCADELEVSLRDTNASNLTIPPRGITISGQEATARVVTELGDRDVTDTIGLVRESGRWKIAEIGAPAG